MEASNTVSNLLPLLESNLPPSPRTPETVIPGKRLRQPDSDPTPRGRPLSEYSRNRYERERSVSPLANRVTGSTFGLGDSISSLRSRLSSPGPSENLGNTPSDDSELQSVAYGLSAEHIRTLYDLLRAQPPPTPAIYAVGALGDTKKVTETEAELVDGPKLHRIVYLSRLVSQLFPVAKVTLDQYAIKASDPSQTHFITHLLPEVPVPLLARLIYSEKDVSSWCESTILRPALAALRSVQAGQVALDQFPVFPYLSSAPSASIIPDSLLVCGENPLEATLTIEHKSQNVLKNIFADLQNKPGNLPDGAAVMFIWPTRTQMTSCDSRTRVLIQVWAQMIHRECRFAILTSSHTTIFLARGEGSAKDTLFMSPSFRQDDCPILAAYCWMALSVGALDISYLNLPGVDEWWVDDENGGCYPELPGIVMTTMYPQPPMSGSDKSD